MDTQLLVNWVVLLKMNVTVKYHDATIHSSSETDLNAKFNQSH